MSESLRVWLMRAIPAGSWQMLWLVLNLKVKMAFHFKVCTSI